jgi:hypothetical protein
MTAAQFESIEPSVAEQLLRARFRRLADDGCPLGEALVIAAHVEVDVDDAIGLMQRGCPAALVVGILA